MPELPLPKEKSCLSRAPERKVGESQGDQEPHLDKKGGIRAKA